MQARALFLGVVVSTFSPPPSVMNAYVTRLDMCMSKHIPQTMIDTQPSSHNSICPLWRSGEHADLLIRRVGDRSPMAALAFDGVAQYRLR